MNDMTMKELIASYEESLALLRGRLKELREAEANAETAAQRWEYHRRYLELEQLRATTSQVTKYMKQKYGEEKHATPDRRKAKQASGRVSARQKDFSRLAERFLQSL